MCLKRPGISDLPILTDINECLLLLFETLAMVNLCITEHEEKYEIFYLNMKYYNYLGSIHPGV